MARITYAVVDTDYGWVGQIIRYKRLTTRWLLRLVRDMFECYPYRMSREGITIELTDNASYRQWNIRYHGEPFANVHENAGKIESISLLETSP